MKTDLMPLPIIVCFKWGKNYPTTYTNMLFRALSEKTKFPFRFVCITDHPEKLDEGIESLAIPEFALAQKYWSPGMWPKLSVFAPTNFEPGTPVLMLDVDIVVAKDIFPLIERVREMRGLHIIHDWHDTHERWFPRIWNKARKSNSSVVGFVAGEQENIWTSFRDKSFQQLNEVAKNDQDFIHELAVGRHFWPKNWVLSFKKSLAWHFPVSLFLTPSAPNQDCFIVCFHGKPDPEDVSQSWFRIWGSNEKFGFRPVPWVKRYWQRYSKLE